MRFAQMAYRRPLNDEQKANLTAIYAAGVAPEVAAKRAFIFTLSNPAFLYPGIGPQDDYAVASRLALTLWDSVPDAALLKAAAAGQLKDATQVRLQAQDGLQVGFAHAAHQGDPACRGLEIVRHVVAAATGQGTDRLYAE